LLAPLDAVVRSRIVEPGEMASPQKAAFTLAITDPKWVRAYVSETDLGARCAKASRQLGHGRCLSKPQISGLGRLHLAVAEFTPKSVETTELRSSLVYEVRVFVKDPAMSCVWVCPQPCTCPLRGSGASNSRSAGRLVIDRRRNPFAQHLMRKEFRHAPSKKGPAVQALDGVSLEVRPWRTHSVGGPGRGRQNHADAPGRGTAACDSGFASGARRRCGGDPQQVQDRISYMPQRFGLYEDLTVAENLDLYADLHGVTTEQRTALSGADGDDRARPFKTRLAGQLSGGMKQKLGWPAPWCARRSCCCSMSPRSGWILCRGASCGRSCAGWSPIEGLTVLLSTAYLDEAERCSRVVLLHQGKCSRRVAAAGDGQCRRAQFRRQPSQASRPPRSLQARLLDRPDIVDAVPDGGRVRFVRAASGQHPDCDDAGSETPGKSTSVPRLRGWLHDAAEAEHSNREQREGHCDRAPVARQARKQIMVQVRELVKRFGAFTAVDHIDFEVRRGEIFGLLGPNGAGKTTTFRMLCGLLTPSGGELHIAGTDVRRRTGLGARGLGYVAQKFSLYGPLERDRESGVLRQCLWPARRAPARASTGRWSSSSSARTRACHQRAVAGGYKQRLAMAAALLHEPEILFLDEPTSGADPLARRASGGASPRWPNRV
jgi:ABC-2 type transport system ATP-binding protein